MRNFGKKCMLLLLAALVAIPAFCAPAESFAADKVSKATASIMGKNIQLLFIDPAAGYEPAFVFADGTLSGSMAGGELVNQQNRDRIAAAASGVELGVSDAKNGAGFHDRSGTVISNEKVLLGINGETREFLGITYDGRLLPGRASWSLILLLNGQKTILPHAVNCWSADTDRILLFTEELGEKIQMPSPRTAVFIKDGVVRDVRRVQAIAPESGVTVLVYGEKAENSAKAASAFPAAGDRIGSQLTFTAENEDMQTAWNGVRSAAACGPIFMENGRQILPEGPDLYFQKHFAAVLSDGRILLGSGVCNYADLCAFLKRLGVADAILLSQGDGSLLYSGTDGYTALPMKKLNDLLVFREPGSAPAAGSSAPALFNGSRVLVDGWEMQFQAYRIDGYNYFKLRDIAFALNNTKKQFDVSWDAPRNTISLSSGAGYFPVGGEMTVSARKDAVAAPTTSNIYLDGDTLSLKAYLINGNNYFKLRDLAEALDFGVRWDGAANCVYIDSGSSYIPE